VRRQLELARAGLVPGQLPAGGGSGPLPPLLRRRLPRGMSDGLGPAATPRPGGLRDRHAPEPALRARRARPAAVPRGRSALRWRPALARPAALLRILRWRQRPRRRRQPPDRLDRPGGPATRRGRPPPPPRAADCFGAAPPEMKKP